MRKSRTVKLVCGVMIVLTIGLVTRLQPVSAEERGTGFSSGVSLGGARFSDGDMGTGFSGRAFLEYAPYIPEIAVRLSAGYLRFEDEVTLGQGAFRSTEDVIFEDIYVTGGLIYRFTRGNTVPFLTANAGIYHYRKEDVSSATGPVIGGVQVSPFDTVDSKDGNDFGVNVGGGVEFFLSENTSLSVELLGHVIFGEVDSQIFDLTAVFRFFPLR
ncbi:MAG: outer membrane beta-barrel protein [Candidatus Vecturithrix sp.]|nr:outer membrane beta-barrel protein [Candidatus Vecturithrix sp.]